VKRAYKYRFYPTDQQARTLAQTFGCVRFIYNFGLATRSTAYKEQGKKLSYNDLSALLPILKEQFPWLKDVSSVPVQQSLRHVETAFQNFYAGHAKYPTFKKKQNAQSATYAASAFSWNGTELSLAKMKESLNIVWSRPLPKGCTPSTVTVSKDCAGRYFVSLLVEEEINPLDVTPKMIGLDLGLKSMVITSNGETHGNPKFFATDEKRLARVQRRHAKKKKGSKNKQKARIKVAKVHARIADRRRDYQHKLSTRIVRENQVICVESLAVKNMVKNHCLAKSISDVGWGEFVRQLEYKAAWSGRILVKIDRWYPSSKRCFECGHVLETLDLAEREWTCPKCHVLHDRDLNAANNILAEGLSVYACGESVRPGRANAQAGNPRRSRKAQS
jgi:putative transposase